MTSERRTNNLRVVKNVLDDGRMQISVTVANLLVQEIEGLRTELEVARVELATAWQKGYNAAMADYDDELLGDSGNPYREDI